MQILCKNPKCTKPNKWATVDQEALLCPFCGTTYSEQGLDLVIVSDQFRRANDTKFMCFALPALTFYLLEFFVVFKSTHPGEAGSIGGLWFLFLWLCPIILGALAGMTIWEKWCRGQYADVLDNPRIKG